MTLCYCLLIFGNWYSKFKKTRENELKFFFYLHFLIFFFFFNLGEQEMMELGVDEGPASKLMSQVPAIVKALHKLLKDRSVKTRQGCFHILTELIIVLPGALSEHIPALIPGIFQKIFHS